MAALRVVSLRDPNRATARPPARRPIDSGVSRSTESARAAVPIVALHLFPVLGYERATDRMARALGAGQKPERVAVHTDVPVSVDRSAFGIGDPGVHGEPGRFTALGELDSLLRSQRPRMIEVQVGYVARQRFPDRPVLNKGLRPYSAQWCTPFQPYRVRRAFRGLPYSQSPLRWPK